VAKQVDAWGVHVGLQDMPVAAVRAIVGDAMTIGGTANTFEDVRQRTLEGVDYIGLGPYRFTTTKQKLSPVLGLAGYQRILDMARTAGITIPVVAIGGITPNDVPALLQAGVSSVAMSGAITHAGDRRKVVSQLMQQ
jgi:thiamine-phosphate pyrophosphorylase